MASMRRSLLALGTLSFALGLAPAGSRRASRADEVSSPAFGSLAGTAPLALEGDIASQLVDGVDRFLLGELARSVGQRERRWSRDTSSPEAYARSVLPQRERLARILGVRDARPTDGEVELAATLSRDAAVGRGSGFTVRAVRWRAFGAVDAEGLLLEPIAAPAGADIIALPDADVSPEALCGLREGVPPAEQYARRLAESGARVFVPALISRTQGVILAERRAHRLTSRELLYRPAFELGRHILGYELEEVLALVDALERERERDSDRERERERERERDGDRGGERERGRAPGSAAASPRKIAVAGWGEGGLLALYAAALDPRIDAALVSGAFSGMLETWQEPIDRNVFGLLETFGGAELLSLIAPRPVIIEACRAPAFELPAGTGGAPARLATPPLAEVRAEVERARGLTRGLEPPAPIVLVESGADGAGPPGTTDALATLLAASGAGPLREGAGDPPVVARPLEDPLGRERRLAGALDRHTQALLVESPYVRAEFLKRLDTSSLDAYERTAEEYRAIFRDEVIGRFDRELLAPRPRSRVLLEGDGWTAHEVVLDVFEDVIAYGLLLVPKGIPQGERRPVVVCQHGLEGRPQHVIGKDGAQYYAAFAARLAERGFVTFAPQNLYIFTDRFRTLQRKANLLGKTLFSVMVPQHEQIVRWLGSLDFVDPSRIGFYGLSYGGKSAMRIPALVKGYCLSICSADFNEWVWKNASTRSPYSYVWTGEYEIFEFDLGSTFNYAEMAALIAPRPFMVERGHFDGVAPDEAVAYEFAKVRHLYEARLDLPGRARIEWFVGPHTIHGVGTFEFLHEHLRWPERAVEGGNSRQEGRG